MPRIDPDLEKGTIRTFKEVAKLAELTEQETNVDAHAVMLLVMRFYRQLPPKLRLAVVTQDPHTFADLLRQAVYEIADSGPTLEAAKDASGPDDAAPGAIGVRPREPKPRDPHSTLNIPGVGQALPRAASQPGAKGPKKKGKGGK